MRWPSFVGAAIALLAPMQGSTTARGQHMHHSPFSGRMALPVPHATPHSHQILGPVSAAGSIPGSSTISANSGSTFSHHHHHHGGGGVLFFPGVYPYYWYGAPYFASSWYGFPRVPTPISVWYGPPAPAPLNFPVPQVVPRVAKAEPDQPALRPGVGGFGVLAGDDAKDAKAKKVRVSNPESLARARQFIAFGDEQFHGQEYSEAYQRYKKAAIAAPDLADSHFRQGLALLAMGRYAPAAKALRHGLALKPDWPQSQFRLNDLYGDNRLAKVTLLEQLATAATERPDNSDLMFLLGVGLYFDRQRDRARLFFERAQELGIERELTGRFLKPAPAAGDATGRQEL
jgi:hypothetical protein